MHARLGDIVDDARARGFAGRTAELAAFDDAVGGRSDRRVLFVHGPGGIGKTTLLLRFGDRARRAGRRVVFLDGREVDPSPEGFRQAVKEAGCSTGVDCHVLLVDGYEEVAPLDAWLRREYLPSLRADDVVVLAGREPPAPAWRGDPRWRHVLAVHRLGDLDPADSADLLRRAGVAEADRDRLARLGQGHPLALALLADAALAGTVPRRLRDVPDLITVLLETVVRDAPSAAHTVGLATCAKAWLTTEDLLRRTVGEEAAPTVWDWLRRRPFVVERPHGLTPHDLTREVLDAEFERRWPDRYRALHRTIHDYVIAGVRAASGTARQLLAQHLYYLHRHGPISGTFYALRAQGSAAVVPVRPADHEQILSIVERGLGPGQADVARAWLAARPEHASVVRTDRGVAGYVHHLLCPTGDDLEARDTVVRAVLDHAARTAPARPGEQINVARFVVGADGRPSDEYAVLAGSVSSIMLWCTTPLAWSYVVTADASFWGPMFDYLAFRPVIELTVDGLPHVVYANDWRRFPVDAWLDLMNEREQTGGTGPPPESSLRPQPMDRAAFGAAVRAALPVLNRPERLADSALVGTSLGGDATRLRTTIVDAVAGLVDEPKGDRSRAVLHRTFVKPAPTQEAAAEALSLPFSTYRRHLARAVDQLTDRLWSIELGGQ